MRLFYLILFLAWSPLGFAETSSASDPSRLSQVIETWPSRPKLAVQQMMAKYGPPQGLSSDSVVWHNAGPYKRIMVTRAEVPHDFPKPHTDYLEHTVAYQVPLEKVQEIVKFDGSISFNRTAGELSARCDLEEHNNLALNLAHQVATGKKSSDEARNAFNQAITQELSGETPALASTLQLPKTPKSPGFPDSPTLAFAPKRASGAKSGKGSEAEALALISAVNESELLAAKAAQKEKVSEPVLGYAKMMQEQHGKDQAVLMNLGQEKKLQPASTQAVEQFRKKAAEDLAAIIPLDGPEFASAYMNTMVKSHGETLELIDTQLMRTAKDDAVKQYLTTARAHVASHLDEAKKISETL